MSIFCQFCGKELSRPCGLKIHEMTCKENPNRIKFKNHVSGFRFMEYKTKEGGWNCNLCSSNFRTRRELNEHKHSFHGNVFRPRPRVLKICEYCGKEYVNLRGHRKTCEEWLKRSKNLSEETKKKMSESRKRWLKENPDKHPWKRSTKFKSVPCEKLKEELRKEFDFVEEYTDNRWSHNYSIDIAFLNKKIAVEVNGNQHYDRQGNLLPYYQERHDYLENQGWKIYEIRYTWCFVDNKINEIKEAINQALKGR